MTDLVPQQIIGLGTLAHNIIQMRAELTQLAQSLAPWITLDEMCSRYKVTGKTLLAMERRGEIPLRIRGRWNRAEVMQWETRRPT